jgi:hypothetical protein
LTRIRERLAALSHEKHRVEEMLREWFATGGIRDRILADGVCGICGHSDTRWEFEVRNRVNGATISDAGSICITRFNELGVLDEKGQETHDAQEKHAILSRLAAGLVKKRNVEIALETVAQVRERLWEVPAARLPRDGGLELWMTTCDRVEAALRGEGKGRGGGKVKPKVFNVFVWATAVTLVVLPTPAFRGILTLQGRCLDDMLELRDGRSPRFRLLEPVLTAAQARMLRDR